MLESGPAKKLVITVNEADRWHGRSVTNALLELFRNRGLAGATVTRAIAGFTGHGAIRTVNLMDGAMPLPVRVEVVDTQEAVERVLPDVFDIVERHQVERDGAAAERLREQAFLTTIAEMGSRLMARELEPQPKKMPPKSFAIQIRSPRPSSSRTIQGG